MQRTGCAGAGVVVMWVLLALVPALVSAQSAQERARAEFGRGVEAYQAGDYAEALAAFQEAYRLKPHPAVRVNMANCYEKLDRPLEALFHFEQFLAETDRPSPAQKREVHAAIARLEARTGLLSLQVAPDGALVRIDGAETRRAPIVEEIRLPAGSHTVEVELTGFEPVRREVRVAGGGRAQLAVSLERAAPEPVPGASEEPVPAQPAPAADEAASSGPAEVDGAAGAEPGSDPALDAPLPPRGGDPALAADADEDTTWLTTPVVVSGVATLALAAGAAVTGVLALSSERDFDDAVRDSMDASLSDAERARARQDGLDASEKADRRALATDILLGAAVAGAAVTTFFLIRAGSEEEPIDQAKRQRWTASPAFGRSGAGLALQGSF